MWERMWNPEDIEPTWVPLPSGLTLQSEYDKPVRKEPTMTPNTEEARRLASELRSVIPPKNHEASRILDSAAFTLRLLAADVNKLEAENEALRADKARLDWLQGQNGEWLYRIDVDEAGADVVVVGENGLPLREAIDAAMKES